MYNELDIHIIILTYMIVFLTHYLHNYVLLVKSKDVYPRLHINT